MASFTSVTLYCGVRSADSPTIVMRNRLTFALNSGHSTSDTCRVGSAGSCMTTTVSPNKGQCALQSGADAYEGRSAAHHDRDPQQRRDGRREDIADVAARAQVNVMSFCYLLTLHLLEKTAPKFARIEEI